MSEASATQEHQIASQAVPHSRVRAIIRLVLLFLSLAIMLLPYLLIFYTMSRRVWRPYAAVWFRIASRLFGLRIRVKGQQTQQRPALLVANHVSYLDIPLYGAVSSATFISRADVAHWPLFGFLAKISDTTFIERIPAKVRLHRKQLIERLEKGQTLIMFAEGSTSNGASVLPFKSSLFSVADAIEGDSPLTIQPITIAYTQMSDGTLLDGALRALYGWYGDMELVPHIKTALGLVGAEVEITFHDPVVATDFADRKELAAYCQQQVAEGLQQSLSNARK
jgi:1-acyl-sn-glycerol-3-phosphate acyltransferase